MLEKTPHQFPQEKQTFLLAGPAGNLEVMTTAPQQNQQKVIGIICHPNPTEGGTMNNKVVTTIARAYEHLGFATVRFNFRGIGNSEGSYGNVTGEIDDLYSVIDWVQRVCPNHAIYLAGFSFGAFVSAYIANQTNNLSQLLSVAPAVDRHDFAQLTNIHCPWQVILAEADEIVSFETALAWAKHPPSPLNYSVMPDSSHFFHGKLVALREMIESFYHS